MPAMETLKKIAEKTTGWARPGEEGVPSLVCGGSDSTRAAAPQTTFPAG
jgi:hypothetical protein